MVKVSAIVVTYNRLNLLKECLQNLLNQSYKVNNIYVINNNSSDGTANYLNHLNNSKVKYKNLKNNLGGAGGFSLGTKLAYEHSDSDYFWLMDDDTMATSTALGTLVKASFELNNDFGFLCSNVRSWSNNIPDNVPGVAKDWTSNLPSNLIKIKKSSFVSVFVSRNIISKLGLPIGQMFIWGDDYDYTIRISSRYNCYLVSNSIVKHKSIAHNGHKYSEDVFNSSDGRINFYQCSYRNFLFIDRKFYGHKKVVKRLLGDIIDLIEIPFKARDKRIKRFWCTLSGIIKGLYFNPRVNYPKK